MFDLLKVLSTHSFNHSQEIRFHFSHKVDEIPVQTLVRFAKVGLKYNLIQTDDINNLAKDIELFKKSKYDFKYERRKNKLEKILGIDILRKQKEHQRKEEIKKNKAALKKPNLSHKSTKKIT